jgi:hypothetical protein
MAILIPCFSCSLKCISRLEKAAKIALRPHQRSTCWSKAQRGSRTLEHGNLMGIISIGMGQNLSLPYRTWWINIH